MPRLFVAINLPSELKLGLAKLCLGVSGARWVAPESFHLTVRFIGEVDGPTAAAIAAALQRVKAPRFGLTLAGVGQFGGHTLWVGIEDNQTLLDLQAAVENELRAVGLAPEARPFLPHVKLAHSRRRRSFRSFLAEHAGLRAESFEVAKFSLIESHSGKSGSEYEHRADYLLVASEEAAPDRKDAPAPDERGTESGKPASARMAR